MSHNLNPILLVGAGRMAIEYAKVLQKQKVPFICVGRSASTAEAFEKQTGVSPKTGGLTRFLNEKNWPPSRAIVCVNVEELCTSTLALLNYGCTNILVEKPGGLHLEEIEKVACEAQLKKANVYVAYNRRFYASTKKAKSLIEEDGGVESFHFEFTELSSRISTSPLSPKVKENWLLANSTHVIDLAFHLGGEPKKMISFSHGGTTWHPVASVFTGAGLSEKNALFSYHANWNTAGRWGIEVMTKKRHLVFRPLEQLHELKPETFSLKKIPLHDQWDQDYKPGLFSLVEAYLSSPKNKALVSIEDQYRKTLSWYEQIKYTKGTI
ncbi:Gfo/Idh/MocA family oxidoreductase [Thalassobacillus sp. C254]|uniref:Gfo/Idh/MocA family oxidoreductase n=1 Tax=Thalassobacillus sp. C254 TaxID=1225341 RepID=UPI0006D1C216|nr:Gfo/Idh/MocA family oxidoreductase [Thalassobacillus sp. C254]